jgi:hypothetical protein
VSVPPRCACGRYVGAKAHREADLWICDACGGHQPKRALEASAALHPYAAPFLVLECDDGRTRVIGQLGHEPLHMLTVPAGERFAAVCTFVGDPAGLRDRGVRFRPKAPEPRTIDLFAVDAEDWTRRSDSDRYGAGGYTGAPRKRT